MVEYLAVTILRVASEEHVYSVSPDGKKARPFQDKGFHVQQCNTGIVTALGILLQLSPG